ncbi:MAG: hypothetical protein M1834_002166 [Cirrosporium novae-zelandiae]|nr:MAG: hypothetical protein M1834_002166 [Cirrosporium novae-zelandiae]
MSYLRKILVTGATGKQGGAVLSQLLAHNSPPKFNLLVLTRNASSARAQALAEKPNVTVIEGDLYDVPAIFEKLEDVWGVYSVQTVDSPEKEETQGKALVDVATEAGVKHFVYSSVDRGGPIKSVTDPTVVPHFASKHAIEKHLELKATSSPQQMTFTILRPTAFMDNLTKNFFGKTFASWWKSLPGTRHDGSMMHEKLQLVAVADIGFFGAKAFLEPEKFAGKGISLAGDDLTWEEGNKIFKKVVGTDMPHTFGLIANAFRWMVKDIGEMVNWFREVGYGADVEECRKINPEMMDFEKFLREKSDWAEKK